MIDLHIGLPKTGTTAIQVALAPVKRYVPTHTLPDLVKLPRLTRVDDELVARLKKRVKADALISWELLSGDFENLNFGNVFTVAHMMRRVCGDREARVILYLRRQDHFAESTYAHLVQTGDTRTFHEWVRTVPEGAYDWRRILAAYRDFEQVVRVYKDGLDLIADFAEVIGQKLDKPHGWVNRGLSEKDVEHMRLCNEGLTDDQRMLLRQQLSTTKGMRPYTRRHYFTATERAAFLETYRLCNEELGL